jgi:hypothetical protein
MGVVEFLRGNQRILATLPGRKGAAKNRFTAALGCEGKKKTLTCVLLFSLSFHSFFQLGSLPVFSWSR